MTELSSNNDAPKMLGERSFGLIFAFIFTVIGLFPMISGGEWREWSLITAGVIATVALLVPIVLRPANIAWMHFGQFMHKIINPILMGLVFFVTVVPTGLVLKVLGKDPMRRRFEPDQSSYWITRTPDTQAKENFDNQF